jgi:four helix bundle protein
MGKNGFKELKVWQESKSLAVQIYRISNEGGLGKDFGLRDQMRRSAVSICSNIAEGDERNTDRDSVRFFHISKGSLAELITQLEIACDVGYIDQDILENLENECNKIGKMLGALIKSRTQAMGNK